MVEKLARRAARGGRDTLVQLPTTVHPETFLPRLVAKTGLRIVYLVDTKDQYPV